MSGQRRARVARAIRECLVGLFEREVSDPRLTAAGLVSVTRVELNRDMSVAEVYLSFIGADDDAGDRAVEALAGAAGFLRGPLGRELKMAKVPSLRFVRDHSVEFSSRITAIVRDDERRAQDAVSESEGEDGGTEPPEE